MFEPTHPGIDPDRLATRVRLELDRPATSASSDPADAAPLPWPNAPGRLFRLKHRLRMTPLLGPALGAGKAVLMTALLRARRGWAVCKRGLQGGRS